jgi:choline dehydrogenase-like flavoprotein
VGAIPIDARDGATSEAPVLAREESDAGTSFPPAERATLRAVLDTLYPAVAHAPSDPAFYALSAESIGLDVAFTEIVGAHLPARRQRQIHRVLRTMGSRSLNLLLSGAPVRFSRLPPARRARFLRAWRDSRLPAKRAAYQSLKRLGHLLAYSVGVPPDGPNPAWPALDYPGEFPEPPAPVAASLLAPPPPGPGGEVEVAADACVIGAGAGGSVVARRLVEHGHAVVLLDAGPDPLAAPAVPRELTMQRRGFWDAGLLATEDLGIQLLAGTGIGGGTWVNWSTCLPPPPEILEEWEHDHGIPGLTGDGFRRDLDAVWRRLSVNDRESGRNGNNDALWRGCRALGYREGVDFAPILRNVVGCRDRCDFCGFGCPFGCKRSSPLAFLTGAGPGSLQTVADARVDRLEHEGGRAQAASGTVRTSDGNWHPLRVRARVFVAAAGAVGTPALLLRSSLGNGEVGRDLRLHPTSAVTGTFPEPILPWAGPPQTVVVTRFRRRTASGHGFWIEAAPAHPGLFALAAPWEDGAQHKRWMAESYARSTATIVLLRDRGAGRVAIDPRGDPVVRYRLGAADRTELALGLGEAARLLAAAGARRLVSVHARPLEVIARGDRLTPGEVEAFADEVARRGAAPNRLLVFSAHLMGGCAMRGPGRRAAVDPDGRLRGSENVFVADASVFPSAPGVNPMVTIEAMAYRTAGFVLRALEGGASSGSAAPA